MRSTKIDEALCELTAWLGRGRDVCRGPVCAVKASCCKPSAKRGGPLLLASRGRRRCRRGDHPRLGWCDSPCPSGITGLVAFAFVAVLAQHGVRRGTGGGVIVLAGIAAANVQRPTR